MAEERQKKATWRYTSKENDILEEICAECIFPSWQHAITAIVMEYLPLKVKNDLFDSTMKAKQEQINQLINIIQKLKDAEESKSSAFKEFEEIKQSIKR